MDDNERSKKRKYLRKEEAKRLLDTLELNNTVNMDYLIMMMIKTGLRFSEALAVTPEDFDFETMKLTVNKAWDYKNGSDFVPTKNQCIRTISIDKKLGMQMSELIKNLSPNVPVFVREKVCNSTYINFLAQKCKQADIPVVGLHTLRHTHAFILLDEGVTIASVLKRLGRSSMIITQNISCPVAAELEVRDNNIIINAMNSL